MGNKIEGGPVCETCKGKKHLLTLGYSDGHCPICRGTGVKSLSEWTDAQKAEWLRGNCRFPQIHLDDPAVFHPPANGIYITCVGEDGGRYYLTVPEPDLSAALTAAVIAVAKERDA